MTILFPSLILIAAILCLPAFLYSRRKGAESWWLPFSVVPGVVVWAGLTALGFGAQSLSNVIELVWLVGAAVALSYVKVFVVDRRGKSAVHSTYVLAGLLGVVAIALRALTPMFPE